ncbi:hypothetical protein [Homoserinibacter sp. GY 40078]|uniref:hypothetical protein n=1 Tax=Homoserinibacter sp. GY 40078 TaxID=2603275 RepID=UPI0011C8101E|nr:hypothetical protein [Homoserinibacter sp. GY 40078]TXK17399.1 hypothetical protein FVQ89_11230 [Homoserinibacter sp. GY 40078]
MATREALTRADEVAADAIRSRVSRYIASVWGSASSLRDADVDRIVRQSLPVIRAGRLQMAQMTASYVLGLARVDGFDRPPMAVDPKIIDYRGVPDEVVYRRPAVQTYTALSKGTPFEAAKQQGLNRLLSIATTDMQQARNRQARISYAGAGYEYRIRTLTGRENCALCVIASTQRYNAYSLMPIHPGCDCGQEGVRGAGDPGQTIDPDLLANTYAAVEEKLGPRDASGVPAATTISDYRNLIVVNQHGELGPTLAWRGDRFTGPDDI